MVRRVATLTSTALVAAGAISAPAHGSVRNTARTAIHASAANATTGSQRPTVCTTDLYAMFRRLQSAGQPPVVHYAVSGNALLPIVQDEALSRSAAVSGRRQQLLQARKSAQAAEENRPMRSGAKEGQNAPRASTRLTSREGAGLLTARAGSPLELRIAALALSFLGAPYRYGGTSPGTGFDCSGFVQYIYAQFGIALPRTSFEQYTVGTPVAVGSLQPGDLLFFSTDAAGPSHVGMYVGNGLMVQALNSTSGVIVSRLSADYYATRFLGARRPIC